MQTLTRGQKTKLAALGGPLQLQVELEVPPPAQTEVDLSCFGLDGAGKLSDDAYFVFYNQKTSPCGALRMEGRGEGAATFDVDLTRLPAKIRKLVFVATLDGPGTMQQIGAGQLTLSSGGAARARYALSGGELGAEKALMVAELYLKGPPPDAEWRLGVVGQGFNGGLKALLEHFGGEALDEPAAPAPAPPEPPAPKVSLGKLTLEKRGDSQKLSLDKGPSAKPIHINLNWTVPAARGLGGLLGGKQSADLDLGCMYELKTGEKGVIQPLGNRFGARDRPPFIFLDQDDRSGAVAAGENMYLFRPDTLKRCVVFAMIYEGSSNFTAVGGRVTLADGRGTEIEVKMDAPHPSRTFCAVCSIESAGDELRIRKEEQYFGDHQECDRHFGFGFRWVAGRK